MKPVDIIFSQGQQRILAPLMLHPDESRSTNNLIDIADKGRGATQRMLDDMVKSGLLIDFKMGNQRRFKANPDFLFYEEIRSICLKSFGLADVIREALWPLRHEIKFAFVFGSMASGKERQGSDIDLLVVGDADTFTVTELLSPAEIRLGRPIHFNLYDLTEWWNMRKSNSLMKSILGKDKILVLGNIPVLEDSPNE
jgi:predicted nucleotidyltransferase